MNHSKKLLALLILLSIQSISYSQTPGQRTKDSLAIEAFKKDTIALNHKLDSLTTVLTNNGKAFSQVFTGGSVAVYLTCILAFLLLMYISKTSPKDPKYALGLPDGSIRAIIAILAILFYISLAIVLSILETKSTIPTDVTKTLGTLVVAISGFYFGAKTAEQGNKTLTDNLNKLLDKATNPPTDVR